MVSKLKKKRESIFNQTQLGYREGFLQSHGLASLRLLFRAWNRVLISNQSRLMLDMDCSARPSVLIGCSAPLSLVLYSWSLSHLMDLVLSSDPPSIFRARSLPQPDCSAFTSHARHGLLDKTSKLGSSSPYPKSRMMCKFGSVEGITCKYNLLDVLVVPHKLVFCLALLLL
ncbi:hypothetical protein U1Q18_010594 [Sarracenia purpurea var. burkii]